VATSRDRGKERKAKGEYDFPITFSRQADGEGLKGLKKEKKEVTFDGHTYVRRKEKKKHPRRYFYLDRG